MQLKHPAIQMLLKISVVQMIDSSMKVLKVNKSLLHKMTVHLDWLDTTFFFFFPSSSHLQPKIFPYLMVYLIFFISSQSNSGKLP